MKLKSIKKLICVGLAMTTVFCNLSACSETPQVEITEITYWDAFCNDMLPDSYCESLIEKTLPIDVVVSRVSNTNASQVAQLLTAKNVPDVFWTSEPNALIESFDITRPIPREMVEEYAPSFLELYDAYPTIYTSVMDPNNTDEFFALNGTTESKSAIAASLYADYYRYDWIEALDIDLGVNVTQISDNFYVADNGLTLDKFEEVMHAFTYGDPDGNGIDDTYGASFEYMTRFDLLYSGFGILNGVNEFEGEAEQFYVTDNFKEFSIWFSEMFEKGYIDDDFMYQDRTARWEKINNEEAGYFLESSIAINSWASDRPPLTLLETNPDAKFLITPGLSNNEGQGMIIKSEMPTYGRLCYIGKDVDDEKLALILQMLEYINFGEDTFSFWFGEENVDWNYYEDGGVNIINNLAVSEKGSRVFVQNVQTGKLFEEINIEPVFAAGSEFWLYDCIWRENDREQYQYKLDLQKETDYSKFHAEYSGACNEINNKFFIDWVYNGLNVEESWDEYLEELNSAGYNIMMDELDKVEPLEEMILRFVK